MSWLVYDNEEGLIGIFDNYEEASKEYVLYRDNCINYVRGEGEFSTEETVILAEVKKHLYSYDTKQPVMNEDADGNEIPSVDTYWDFKEDCEICDNSGDSNE